MQAGSLGKDQGLLGVRSDRVDNWCAVHRRGEASRASLRREHSGATPPLDMRYIGWGGGGDRRRMGIPRYLGSMIAKPATMLELNAKGRRCSLGLVERSRTLV